MARWPPRNFGSLITRPARKKRSPPAEAGCRGAQARLKEKTTRWFRLAARPLRAGRKRALAPSGPKLVYFPHSLGNSSRRSAASDFSSEAEIFAELAKMQQTGIFGMHGPLRSAYRFTDDYPLATLAIDPDILEQRWELTHPALVRDEEDMFW